MPVRLLESLSLRGVSFQDRRFLAIGTSREDDLCNDVSQDGVIMCHSSSTLYMIHILHSYKLYVTIFATAGNENGVGRSPDQFFPCGEKWSGNETRYRALPRFLSLLPFFPLHSHFTSLTFNKVDC